MSDTAIKADNLSRKYVIGHQKQERYTALRDVMANKAESMGGRALSRSRLSAKHLVLA